MNQINTVKLLRMAKLLMRDHPESSAAFSIGRDLYDFAIQQTTDINISYQAESARREGYDRLKCIGYLKHRLNLPIY
jgi:hypothetical protein